MRHASPHARKAASPHARLAQPDSSSPPIIGKAMGCCSSKDVATKRSGAPLPRIVDDDMSYSHSSTVHGGAAAVDDNKDNQPLRAPPGLECSKSRRERRLQERTLKRCGRLWIVLKEKGD
ncbi:hypothetical protein EJB05_18895 [Eragrostis curvula]|uniref:Uncharacterized protein n=1 Tax=Eragrostis curvula TaxID=38414 RepID=A0A5J9VMD8_9POAL|nr:hypothetical protein EJB05_18895 [Eragrostis curvula]